MQLLLLSNSVIPGLEYLEWAESAFSDFFKKSVKNIAFIPFAGVTINWDDYEAKVSKVFAKLGYNIFSLHREKNPVEALNYADAVAVGGDNTFKLVHDLHKTGLTQAIREKVINGMPYTGWSAGANVACPTLRTTNDMPIVDPNGFETLNLVPFQINPHYLDKNPDGFAGETREERIREFLELNRDVTVVGLREGTLLRVEGKKVTLFGSKTARIFRYNHEFYELGSQADFSFLLM